MKKWQQLLGLAGIFFLTAIITFGVIVNKQNTAYASIKTNPPVFLEIKEATNKDYIAVNPPSPFALVPTAANFSAPGYPANIPPIPSINSLPNMPDMPLISGLNPDMAFVNSLYIKAIIYSKNKNNIAVLSNGQNEIAVGVGQETAWGRVDAINMDSVVIGQEKISARPSI